MRAEVIGLWLGMVLVFLCYMLMGAGHGVYAPFAICFGPLGYFESTPLFVLALYLAPCLYGAYASLLRYFKTRGLGLRTYALLAIVHHLCVALQVKNFDGKRIAEMWDRAAVLFVAVALFYFGAHLAGILYVTRGNKNGRPASEPPVS